MKKIITILFLGLSIFANAQHTLTGKVTNTKNQPLSGVDIYISNLGKGTITNEKGDFKLTDLSDNQITVTIAFMGYETQNKTVTLDQLKNPLAIVLIEDVFKMDEIIISTPFNKLQSQNVMKVEKASIQQLNNTGAATLVQGITSIPGVSDVSTGIGIGKPVIRGLRGNRVLVYTQGLRLENQQFGEEHGLGIDESSIESVEVIKGPASLLYGSDAMGGVIFFNPKQFALTNTFDTNFSQKYYSNTLGSSTNFGARQSYNNWKFLVNGTYNIHSDYKLPNNQRVTDSRFNEKILDAGIGYSNKLIKSDLRFNFSKSLIGIPDYVGIQSARKSMIYPFQDLTTKMLSLATNFNLANSKILTTLGYTSNDRKEITGFSPVTNLLEPSLQLSLTTLSYDVKWELPKLNNIETIIGVQGMYQKNKTDTAVILIPSAITNDFGTFITSSYSWNSNSIQGGLRFDSRHLTTEDQISDEGIHFNAINKSFQNLTASFGYKTDLFKVIQTRLNLALGFRAPNISELTSNGVHEGTNRYEIGNNNLKSERNFQSDISLEYSSSHFEIYTNSFYNRINNYIFIAPTGVILDNNFVYRYAQNNAELYGGEFGIHIHPHPIDWLHYNSNFQMVIGKQFNGNNLPLIPADKITNTVRAELNISKKLENLNVFITLENDLAQKKVSQFETPSKGYNLVNVGLFGTLKGKKTKTTINLNANNLFNKTYISNLSRLKDNGIPNIGRNIVVGIKFNL